MAPTPKRGGRASLNDAGSTPVPIRFGVDDLALIDRAWHQLGAKDRSTFIRSASIDKANEIVDGNLLERRQLELAAATARRNDSAVLSAIEGELLAATMELIGQRTPTVWGGGTITGPTRGVPIDDTDQARADADRIGFDHSSLAQYLLFRALGITLPRTPQEQFQMGVAVAEPEPADLVFLRPARSDFHDIVAVYLGRGTVAAAGNYGTRVSVAPIPASGVIELRRYTGLVRV